MNILYIRNFPDKVNMNFYNLQEVGFGKAFVNDGHNCDVVYYSNEYKFKKEMIYKRNGCELNIIWMKPHVVLKNGIYSKILRKSFLDQYDIVISTEYNQVMTYLLSKLCSNKLVLYHGPYKDGTRKWIHKIYDLLFLKTMVKNIRYVMTKSNLSREYLIKKGFKNAEVLGVGLDQEKLEADSLPYNKLIKRENDKYLLYVGRFNENKNVKFLLDILAELKKYDNLIKLILVGASDSEYKPYHEYAKKMNIEDNIINIGKVEQKYLKDIYGKSDLFILPSKYEIFGMVLLESMYFGLPVVSSYNGGSSTIITSEKDGIIINNFNVKEWCYQILKVLNDKNTHDRMRINAHEKVESFYTWNKILKRFYEIKEQINNLYMKGK